MGNSETERDFNDQGGLKRPGRLDFRTLNNVDDAGDGYPGMQKAIRNWHNSQEYFLPQDYDIYYCSTEAEINQAITDIGSEQGIIQLYNGTITLTAPIAINGGGSYIIQGQGDNSVIDINGDWRCFDITSATSLVLKDFKIDATDLSTSTKEVIYVDESSDNPILIDNVTIVGDGTNGYLITLVSDDVIVRNCNLSNGKYGILMGGGIKLIIVDNHISSCTDYGIGDPGSGGEYHKISGNICYSNTIAGIKLNGNDYCTISNNVCYSNGVGIYLTSSHYNTISGNNCSGNTQHGIYLLTSSRNTITGNNCNGNTINGILLSTSSQYNNISGNTCDNNDSNTASETAGIFLDNNGDNSWNTITGNNCNSNRNSGSGDAWGIYSNGGDNCLISGNACNVNDGGMYLQGVEKSTITGNNCYGNTNGIVLSVANYNTITGNNCSGNDSNDITIRGAINISGCNNNSITGNNCSNNNNAGSGDTYGIYIDGNTTSCYSISITGNTISNNDHGIGMYGNNKDCTISGNNCYSNNGKGIYLQKGTIQPSRIAINGNSIRGGEEAIYLDLNVTECSIVGNTIGFCEQGIYLLSGNDFNNISGNMIATCTKSDDTNDIAGINLNSTCDKNVISGNMVYGTNNSGTQNGYGILINSSDCDDNMLAGNSCDQNDVEYLDSGTGTVDDSGDGTTNANLNRFG